MGRHRSPRRIAALALFGWFGLAGAPASAECVVKIFATLDIAGDTGLPVTQGAINGHAVRLLVGSGSFYSMISPAAATEAGLSVKPIPPSIQVQGLGGEIPAGRAYVEELKLSNGSIIQSLNFIVGGSFAGVSGVIGQNVLGLRDVEYDLAHHAVRLSHAENCLGTSPTYWTGNAPVASIPIERMEGLQLQTTGPVTINGMKLRARFNTAMTISILSLKAARRLKISPAAGAGATPIEADGRALASYPATLDSVDIGGELVRGARMNVLDLGALDADVLIGMDFFRANRVYVANELRRMFFTYAGGSIFGATPVMPGPGGAHP